MIFGNNKKGNAVMDGITILVVATAFALVSIFGYSIFGELNTDIQSDPQLADDAKSTSGDLYGKYDSLLDNLFMLMFILFVLFVLVSAFMVDTHPVFFIVSVVMLIGVFIVAPILANAFDDVMLDPTVATAANAFTYTGWVMSHLVEVIIGIVFLVVIALFIKFRA